MKTTITRTVTIKLTGQRELAQLESMVDVFTIPKTTNKVRTIYNETNEQIKTMLSAYGKEITRKVLKLDKRNAIHGFVTGRNCVTNAMQHIGYAYTLCFDLKDFFESVTTDKLTKLISAEMLQIVTVDGAARQGLPSSPAIANLAFMKADTAIVRALDKLMPGENCYRYTRYADDLSISFNDKSLASAITEIITKSVNRSGFAINKRKTRLLVGGANRRIITGIAVSETDVHPTRKVRRKLRAAAYQYNCMSKVIPKRGQPLTTTQRTKRKTKKLQRQRVVGLREWVQCKVPHTDIRTKADVVEFRKILKAFNIDKKMVKFVPPKQEDIVFDNGIVITKELGQMMGMSTFTSGWESCHSYPCGGRRKGSFVWAMMPKVYMAYMPSTSEPLTYNGITRPRMVTRTLVYRLGNKWWHGRIYPSNNQDDQLFRDIGIEHIDNLTGCSSDETVPSSVDSCFTGHHVFIGKFDGGLIPNNMEPYLDNISKWRTTDNEVYYYKYQHELPEELTDEDIFGAEPRRVDPAPPVPPPTVDEMVFGERPVNIPPPRGMFDPRRTMNQSVARPEPTVTAVDMTVFTDAVMQAAIDGYRGERMLPAGETYSIDIHDNVMPTVTPGRPVEVPPYQDHFYNSLAFAGMELSQSQARAIAERIALLNDGVHIPPAPTTTQEDLVGWNTVPPPLSLFSTRVLEIDPATQPTDDTLDALRLVTGNHPLVVAAGPRTVIFDDLEAELNDL